VKPEVQVEDEDWGLWQVGEIVFDPDKNTIIVKLAGKVVG